MYNYEIEYNGKFYIQTQGCPMDAHYAPLFAIVFMNDIETEVLYKLKQDHKIEPLIFKRYIDDVIMGPFDHDMEIFKMIRNVFNSINGSIQFTLDVPNSETKLNFLDISVFVKNECSHYKIQQSTLSKWLQKN